MSLQVAPRPPETAAGRRTGDRSPVRAPERWNRTWSGRRLGPFPLGVLMVVEAGGTLVLLALLARPLLVPGLLVLVAAGSLTLVRAGRRPLWRHLRVLRTYAHRQQAAASQPRSGGFPTAEHEELVPLLHLAPDLTVRRVDGRSGGPAGLVCDGRAFTAVLAPDGRSMVSETQPVGVGLLADLCDIDGCGFDSGQLLVTVTPAASVAAGVLPALVDSYAQVNPSAAPRSVDWRIALRRDPTRPARVGSVPALTDAALETTAAVRSAANRATKALSAAGLHARMLTVDETVSALGGSCLADRRRVRPGRDRFTELPDEIAIDGLVHVTAWVRDLGEHPGCLNHLLDLAVDLPVQTAVVSLLVTVTGQRRLRLSAYLRLTAATSEIAQAALHTIRGAAGEAGLDLVPLTNEQAAGLRATVPLGGGVL